MEIFFVSKEDGFEEEAAFFSLPSQYANSDKSLIRSLMAGIKDMTLTLG